MMPKAITIIAVGLTIGGASVAQARGPQNVACPAGAVDIVTGASIQSIVDANPSGTTFCFRSGTFTVASSVTPKSGDIFVGEYGAILDGTGWSSANIDDGAIRAVNGVASNVTVRNLTIRNMPQNGVKTDGTGWIVEDNEIAAAGRTGVAIGPGGIVRRNQIHDSVYGNYSAFRANDALFEDNEMSYGGNEQKIVDAARVTFRGNWIHHNHGNGGSWYDAAKSGSLVEGNTVEDNEGEGIFIEQSPTDVDTALCATGGITVRNNIIRRNAVSGVFVSISHCVDIYSNTLVDNYRGLNYFIDCQRINGTVDDLTHVNSHDNDITSSSAGQLAGSFSYLASTCPSTTITPYVAGLKDLVFQHNTYRIPTALTGASLWSWGNSAKTWEQWQVVPQDIGSVLVIGDVSQPPPSADAISPVVTLTAKRKGNSSNWVVTSTASDNVAVTWYRLWIDSTLITVDPRACGAGCTVGLTQGNHQFKAEASDLAGNYASATQNAALSVLKR